MILHKILTKDKDVNWSTMKNTLLIQIHLGSVCSDIYISLRNQLRQSEVNSGDFIG